MIKRQNDTIETNPPYIVQPVIKQTVWMDVHAPYCGHGYVPLRLGGSVVMRMGTQQQQFKQTDFDNTFYACLKLYMNSLSHLNTPPSVS